MVLNSCKSANQLTEIVGDAVPFAVGMLDSVNDVAAITFAERFYATIANGQSFYSAVASAKAYLSILNMSDSELPFIACAPNADPK